MRDASLGGEFHRIISYSIAVWMDETRQLVFSGDSYNTSADTGRGDRRPLHLALDRRSAVVQSGKRCERQQTLGYDDTISS